MILSSAYQIQQLGKRKCKYLYFDSDQNIPKKKEDFFSFESNQPIFRLTHTIVLRVICLTVNICAKFGRNKAFVDLEIFI